MKIGIVGGSGFIGSHLYENLKKRGHEVTVFDLDKSDSVHKDDFIRLDITDPDSFDSSFNGYNIIFHKVGLMGPAPSFQNPKKYYEVNVEGTLNVLHSCLTSGVEKFIFDSTESIFSKYDEAPFKVDQKATPLSIYGTTKYICEQYIRFLGQKKNISTTIFRYPRIISSGQDNIFTVLADKVKNKEDIKVTAGGKKKFDLVHIEDVIKWNCWVVENEYNGILHVSSGFATNVKEIVNLVSERLHGKDKYDRFIFLNEETENDKLLPNYSVLNNKKSLNITGLHLKYSEIRDYINSSIIDN